MWLRPEQPDLAPIVEEICARCAEEGHTPPAYVTVAHRDRLDLLDLCYDPRDISHVYVKDPDTQAWRPVR